MKTFGVEKLVGGLPTVLLVGWWSRSRYRHGYTMDDLQAAGRVFRARGRHGMTSRVIPFVTKHMVYHGFI